MMQRMWINQPSTLQPDHKLHGRNVLADDKNDYTPGYVIIYFVDGSVESQVIARLSLSKGWTASNGKNRKRPLHNSEE